MNQAVERFLTAPEPNAAGRLALFRILFGVFYLWILSHQFFQDLGAVPTMTYRPLLIIRPFATPPAPEWFAAAEFMLVAAVVWMTVGYKTRAATLVALVIGVWLGGFRYSFGRISHTDLFLVAYLPALFVFYNWGQLYSVDALLRARRGLSLPDAHDSGWGYGWPVRAMLLLLAVLFFGATYSKTVRGTWLTDPDIIPHILRQQDLRFELSARPLNPISALIMSQPLLHTVFRFLPLLFEGSFFLSLFSRPLRNFFLASAILFHIFNGYVLDVWFTPMLTVYALFIDWQWLYDRLPNTLRTRFQRIRVDNSSAAVLLQIAVIVLTIGILAAWNGTIWLRPIIQSLIDPLFLWAIVGIVAVGVLLKAVLDLARSLRRGIRSISNISNISNPAQERG